MKSPGSASLVQISAGRYKVAGRLDFASVGSLLDSGARAIESGATDKQLAIDLAQVSASDSAGLALLIEWQSVAQANQCALHYENVPSQVRQLARLSEVEELLLR